MARRHWLFKSEPDSYSFDDLLAEPDQACFWDGVRNYQARNLLRDEVKPKDRVLFYHSRAKPPHVAGVAEVIEGGTPDWTALDKKSAYYDDKATREAPRWYGVRIRAVRKLEPGVGLPALKDNPALEGMRVVQKGQRLSVQPVDKAHYDEVLRMHKRLAAGA